ncbi:hypothetical protein GC194_13015 [bacterium]|nr:hypothetical protein [bacterium]
MKRTILVLAILLVVATLVILFWPQKGSEPVNKQTTAESGTVEIIKGLKTCPVCGYDALTEKGEVCGNCGYAINKQEMEEELLGDINSLIIARQLEFFMPDTLGKPIDFLKPEVSPKGYPKNESWRPKVYESQVFEYQKMLLELENALAPADSSESAENH